jgi:hypothetical protein
MRCAADLTMLFTEASCSSNLPWPRLLGFSALEYRSAAAAVDGLARLRSALMRPPSGA